MAFVSLFSCPPNPVLHKNMTDSELAGDEREDGELEDGEIDDEGIGIDEKEEDEVTSEPVQKEKEKVREKEDKTHRHSHKRHKKIKEKRKVKKRRRDRQKHHSPSSDSSSDSYNSDYEHQDRSKGKKNKITYRDYDGQFAHHDHEYSAGHGKAQRSRNSESEDTYDLDEDQEDFSEELSKYKHAKETNTSSRGRPPKDHVTRPGMNRQQFGGPRGRGRGGGMGRGRGLLNKNKNQKNKTWGRGRGGGEHGGDGASTGAKGPPSFQKKRPIMSQEFISQHTIEHNGRHICKYFIEGRCIKGDQCKFEHDNVVPGKKKELCKFYVQGYCTKGENCIYMHNEYPCKFFHTGAKCYQGDNCKFSHEPLTEITKELLAKILNTDEDHTHKDDLEVEDLRKHGIAPLPKPPPGVGLLPTPGAGSPQDGSKKIPSLFEIKVLPTVDLAQKIALRPSFYNSTSPPPGQFEGNEGADQFSSYPEDMQAGTMMSPGHSHQPPPSGSPGSMGSPPTHFAVPGFPKSPPGPLPPHGYGQGPPVLHNQHFHPHLQHTDHQSLQMRPPGSSFQSEMQTQMNMPLGQMPSEFFKNLFSSHSLGLAEKGPSGSMQDPQQSSADPHSGMQDLLPAVQKVLLLHLNQKQQDSDSHRADIQGHVPSGKDKDESTNWYSSDDEDGSSVTAILKTLKQQNEKLKAQQFQTNFKQLGIINPVAHTDPRLHKERAPSNDPRVKGVKGDPKQLPAEAAVLDPRAARDPRKIKPADPNSSKGASHRPVHHPGSSTALKTPVNDEDEEGERELREKAALIPWDPSPGATLRDPRCQIKQFSHIRVDILLQRPAFAHSVVWAPEDLIPLLIPRQDPSINLPLPPLIADAQLNRSLSSPPDHSHSSSLAPPDPRLAAARLKEGGARLHSPPGRTISADKPADPRTHKTMLDPRISRSGSLDSKLPSVREGPSVDPRLQQGCRTARTSIQPDPEKLPPYAPRLASTSGNGLESSSALLGGISLYDPRHHTSLLSPKREAEEPQKKVGILKQVVKHGSASPPHHQAPSPSPPRAPQAASDSAAEKNIKASDEDSESHTLPTADLAPPPSPPIPVVAAPALHNLPIPPLAGLMRPAYSDPRQNRQSGQTHGAQEEEQEEEQDDEEDDNKDKEEDNDKEDRLLKDVFKTFDPTASPFCQ